MADGPSDSFSSSAVLRRPQKGRLAALRDEPSKARAPAPAPPPIPGPALCEILASSPYGSETVLKQSLMGRFLSSPPPFFLLLAKSLLLRQAFFFFFLKNKFL